MLIRASLLALPRNQNIVNTKSVGCMGNVFLRMMSGYTTNETDQANAAKTRAAGQIGSTTKLADIADIERAQIDDGLQKYVLVKVIDDTGTDHYFVRGNCAASYIFIFQNLKISKNKYYFFKHYKTSFNTNILYDVIKKLKNVV